MFKIDSDKLAQRYDISKFMSNENGSILDSVDSEFMYKLKNLSRYGTYTVISEVGRPDLLSERIYGAGLTQYWWILMMVNELRFPWDLTMNLVLRYPLIDDLEDIYFSLTPDVSSVSAIAKVESLS